MTTPKLRFKEFDGYWNKNTIGNFVLNYKGGASLTPADFVDYSECEVIPKKAISSGGALQLDKDVPTFCTPEFFNLNQNYVVDSEYLITTLRDLVPSGPSIGYIVKYEGDKQYILAQGVYGFRIKNDLCRDFLIQFSNTSKFRLHMQSIMVGSTQVHIRNHDYFSTELCIPSLLEQTKIAAFLSAVDEKITQLTQKHQLLSQYKQGMMQKLFSQQIRFKADDGSEFGKWESKKISDLFDEVRNKVADRDIETYSITAGKGFVSQANKFGRDISGKQNSNYIVLKPNDFSYNKGNSKTYKYGCVYLNELNYDIAVPNVFISFRSKKLNLVHEKFYSKLFEFHYLDRYLRLLISSSARMDGLLNVSKDGFFEIKLPYPCLEEQTKIANFLSAIDQKIDVVSEQLEQAKLWKKGLLQQMFV
ncbi:restriction endonuclease subunit S [Acinetobacter sp. WCHA39]|uniref:restriction endonuclease subunit S n=1 Tax=Acinetobacter sp. WCHA39 TaxID=2004648 RepID=UPI000B3C3B40|nr:restriction endonuclease subunit S [Acinetobacter sp. WCHA39]AZM39818.1 restriction endonuclease subunit S [Acinetobacter baumannii]